MKLAYIQIHVAVLLFGFSGLFAKWIQASPILIVEGRTLVAALFIGSGLLLSKSLHIPSTRHFAWILLSGVVLLFHWLTFFYAIQISTVAVGLIGFSTYPVFVTRLEPIFFQQSFRRIDIVCVIIVVVGLLVLTPDFSLSNSTTKGLFWAVISGALNAIFTLLNRSIVKKVEIYSLVLIQQGIVAIILLPFMFSAQEEQNAQTWWLLILLGIAFTAIPQSLYIKSLTRLKAQLVSIVTCLEPVYSIALAALLLNEMPGVKELVGSCIVFGAVVFSLKAHSQMA